MSSSLFAIWLIFLVSPTYIAALVSASWEASFSNAAVTGTFDLSFKTEERNFSFRSSATTTKSGPFFAGATTGKHFDVSGIPETWKFLPRSLLAVIRKTYNSDIRFSYWTIGSAAL